VFEKRVAILAYVVILRAVPKTVRVCVVMTEGDSRSLREFFGTEPWSVGCSHGMNNDTRLFCRLRPKYAKPLGRIQSSVGFGSPEVRHSRMLLAGIQAMYWIA